MNKRVFCIGIGGVGVSSLAQYYMATGWTVAGSDAEENDTTKQLTRAGAEIHIGADPADVAGADLLIMTTAIKPDHPQLVQARALGITVKTYPEAVGELTRSHTTVSIAGAHGKSTTTAMSALIMIEAGLDPTVIIGTKLKEFDGTNFRLGKSKYLLVEADEYKGAFWHYHSQIAALLNIDIEHLDFYKDLDDIQASFTRYLTNVAKDGTIIVNGQNKLALELVEKLSTPPDIVVFDPERLAHRLLKIPGAHNQSNAEAAAQIGQALEIDEVTIERSLAKFAGTWRRLEEIQPRIFSDYAHHPTEITATLAALKEAYPNKKLIAVCQLFQKDRLNRLFDSFVPCFDQADEVFLTPLYIVRGRDRDEGKDEHDLAEAINKPTVKTIESVDAAYEAVLPEVESGAIVVFLGNGDIDAQLRELLSK